MNHIYPKFKDRLAARQADWAGDTFHAVLMATGISYVGTHEALSDLGIAPNAYSDPLANKSTLMGTFYADTARFSNVTGDEVGVVLIIQGEATPQALLVAYIDDIRGFPFTPTGVDADVLWSGVGGSIFTL